MNSLTSLQHVQCKSMYKLVKEDENWHLHPQLSLLMLRLYHLRRNFAVSIKFVNQHVEDDNICEKIYYH